MNINVDVNKVLEQLATAFNISVEHLYPILIRQAYIDGITSVVSTLFLGFVIFFLTKIGYKKKKNNPHWQWGDDGIFLVVAILIVTIMFIICFIYLLTSGITALFNPEYYVITDVLDRLK